MGDFVSFTVVASGPDPAGKKQARLPFHRVCPIQTRQSRQSVSVLQQADAHP